MPASNVAKAWQELKNEAAGCTRCHLYRCATQTVFGEGPLDCSILFVGELLRRSAHRRDRHHLAEQRAGGSRAQCYGQGRAD